ncbi:MAG: hypothetical protein ACD_37C00366G0001 [uncultured bacterium]|nr:MAG: hypothetical protein ACD_37C00366G0001 [uncultured bacterium]
MIKTIVISSINIYQIIISVTLKNILGVSTMCRFEETCSAFTKRSVKEKGILIGVCLGFIRILKCQPISAK